MRWGLRGEWERGWQGEAGAAATAVRPLGGSEGEGESVPLPVCSLEVVGGPPSHDAA